jgi:hypothetical protein
MPTLPEGAAGAAGAREVNYFREHRNRMDYRAARRAGELIGSGPVEATGRQYQSRLKRPGQFWSREGDEALMCLETFWRNDRCAPALPSHGLQPCKKLRCAPRTTSHGLELGAWHGAFILPA